ncbi:hypothetical protein BKA70DRAFT_1399988 [Coprinopsis sp. MPI-PUGE-AT-0042]|nr:hypothetical protein BKA70DRAFT_1399988 [Coprinopsis sp. MPI-PUGE-AT-0042]
MAKTSNEQRANINNAYEELVQTLRKAGVRAKVDLRDGWCFPLRLEIGFHDLAKKQTLTIRCDTNAKNSVPLDNIGSSISSILETIQAGMFFTATVTEWNDVVPALDAKNIVVIPWCESEACEADVRDRSGRSTKPLERRRRGASAPIRLRKRQSASRIHVIQSPTATADSLDSRFFILRGSLIKPAGSHNQLPQGAGGRGQPLGQVEGSDGPSPPFYQASGHCCKKRAASNTIFRTTCAIQLISTSHVLRGAYPYGGCNDTSRSAGRKCALEDGFKAHLMLFGTFHTLSDTSARRWLIFSNRRTPAMSRRLDERPQDTSLVASAMFSGMSEGKNTSFLPLRTSPQRLRRTLLIVVQLPKTTWRVSRSSLARPRCGFVSSRFAGPSDGTFQAWKALATVEEHDAKIQAKGEPHSSVSCPFNAS